MVLESINGNYLNKYKFQFFKVLVTLVFFKILNINTTDVYIFFTCGCDLSSGWTLTERLTHASWMFMNTDNFFVEIFKKF